MTCTRPWIRRWVHVPVAQWIAHQTSNLGVAGSNPVGYFASIAQLAEHLPRKQKVSSSNLDGGCTGRWSRGMILASGARGRGFDSRTAPLRFALFFVCFIKCPRVFEVSGKRFFFCKYFFRKSGT